MMTSITSGGSFTIYSTKSEGNFGAFRGTARGSTVSCLPEQRISLVPNRMEIFIETANDALNEEAERTEYFPFLEPIKLIQELEK